MTEQRFDSYAVEMQFNGSTWVNVDADVVGNISCEYGIRGNSPTDRIASTGILSITLNNSASNSGSLEGYYSPGHANNRAGFEIGLPVRISFVYQDMIKMKLFRIPNDGITVQSGIYGPRRTTVKAHDWMGEAATHEMKGVSIATNQRMNEALLLVTDSMIRPPQTEDYKTGDYTFPTAFDTLQPGTKALTEITKGVRSEFGFLNAIGNALNGETLLAESLSTRPDKTAADELSHVVLMTEDSRPLLTEHGLCLSTEVTTTASFSNSMMELVPSRGKHIINRASVITQPRETKSAVVLFVLQKPLYIEAGETLTGIIGSYRDPDNEGVRVTGTNMLAPVSGTDFKMFENEDETGDNLTTSLTVTPDYDDPAIVEYSLENTSSLNAWITVLRALGDGIVRYDPITQQKEDATSKTAYGVQNLPYNMPYQSDPSEGPDIAAAIIARYKDPFNNVESMRFCANRSEFLMRAFMQIEPGDRIETDETVTGIDADFFVNGVSFEVLPGGVVFFKLLPVIPMGWTYLGIAEKTTTIRASTVSFGFVKGESVVNLSTAKSIATAHATNELRTYYVNDVGDTDFIVDRSFLKFDTSGLLSRARITSVKLRMSTEFNTLDAADDFDVSIMKHDWSSQDPLSAGNRTAAFQGSLNATQDDSIWQNTGDVAEDTLYNSGELDTSHINRSGFTYYSIRSSAEINETVALNYQGVSFYDPTDATLYPRLLITWEIP